MIYALASSSGSMILRMVLAIGSTPILFSAIGAEGYARYAFALAMVPIFSILEAVLLPAIRRTYATMIGKNRRARAMWVQRTGVDTSIFAGLVALSIVLATTILLASQEGQDTNTNYPNVSLVLCLLSALMSIATSLTSFAEAEAGVKEQIPTLRWMELGAAAAAVCVLLVVHDYLTPSKAFVILQSPTIAARLIYLRFVRARGKFTVRVSILLMCWRAERKYGALFFSNQILLSAQNALQQLAAGISLTPEDFAGYSLANRILGAATSLSQIINGTAMPMLMNMALRKQGARFRRAIGSGFAVYAVLVPAMSLAFAWQCDVLGSVLSRSQVTLTPTSVMVLSLTTGVTMLAGHAGMAFNALGAPQYLTPVCALYAGVTALLLLQRVVPLDVFAIEALMIATLTLAVPLLLMIPGVMRRHLCA